jgi:hypothetical protein
MNDKKISNRQQSMNPKLRSYQFAQPKPELKPEPRKKLFSISDPQFLSAFAAIMSLITAVITGISTYNLSKDANAVSLNSLKVSEQATDIAKRAAQVEQEKYVFDRAKALQEAWHSYVRTSQMNLISGIDFHQQKYKFASDAKLSSDRWRKWSVDPRLKTLNGNSIVRWVNVANRAALESGGRGIAGSTLIANAPPVALSDFFSLSFDCPATESLDGTKKLENEKNLEAVELRNALSFFINFEPPKNSPTWEFEKLRIAHIAICSGDHGVLQILNSKDQTSPILNGELTNLSFATQRSTIDRQSLYSGMENRPLIKRFFFNHVLHDVIVGRPSTLKTILDSTESAEDALREFYPPNLYSTYQQKLIYRNREMNLFDSFTKINVLINLLGSSCRGYHYQSCGLVGNRLIQEIKLMQQEFPSRTAADAYINRLPIETRLILEYFIGQLDYNGPNWLFSSLVEKMAAQVGTSPSNTNKKPNQKL